MEFLVSQNYSPQNPLGCFQPTSVFYQDCLFCFPAWSHWPHPPILVSTSSLGRWEFMPTFAKWEQNETSLGSSAWWCLSILTFHHAMQVSLTEEARKLKAKCLAKIHCKRKSCVFNKVNSLLTMAFARFCQDFLFWVKSEHGYSLNTSSTGFLKFQQD